MEEFMNRQEAVRRATELVEQMSVEELASQLRFDADEIPHLDIPEYNFTRVWSLVKTLKAAISS